MKKIFCVLLLLAAVTACAPTSSPEGAVDQLNEKLDQQKDSIKNSFQE